MYLRLYVSNTKDQIIFLLFEFLVSFLSNKEVKTIYNGTPIEGTVNHIKLDEEDYGFIEITVGEEVIRFSFLEDSKVRLDKGLFYFETKSNTLLIYV